MSRFDCREFCRSAVSKGGNCIAGMAGFIRKNADGLRYYTILLLALTIVGSAAYQFRSGGKEIAETDKVSAVYEQGGEAAEPMFSPVFPEKKVTAVAPVDGRIIGEYADDRLLWSEDLQQWQTHPATDFSAEAGEAVVAAYDGVVLDAYDDYLYGKTIVIDHGEYGTIRYASLGTLEYVEIGAHVGQGDIIGCAGVCPAEKALGIHLHVEYLVEGEPKDLGALLHAEENEPLQD